MALHRLHQRKVNRNKPIPATNAQRRTRIRAAQNKASKTAV